MRACVGTPAGPNPASAQRAYHTTKGNHTLTDPPDREVSFQGRTFLVTGASRGIGRAVAVALGVRRATVAVHYGRRDDSAREVVAAVEAAGGRAFAVGATSPLPTRRSASSTTCAPASRPSARSRRCTGSCSAPASSS